MGIRRLKQLKREAELEISDFISEKMKELREEVSDEAQIEDVYVDTDECGASVDTYITMTIFDRRMSGY
ncbi:MAG: hypothetical protein GY757_18945 [bacterium]|nr:hypothetical protein [bacterium]